MQEREGRLPKLDNILVVKLADIGDLLTATPSLRALRETFPSARISALVTPGSAPVLDASPLVDQVILFDKFSYDRATDAVRFEAVRGVLRLMARLRKERFDCIIILHHLVTKWGMAKYAFLAFASGAQHRVGLDNGRGWFLTRGARDHGFGHLHEVDYSLAVVDAIGASTKDRRLEVTISREDTAVAEHLLGGNAGRPIVAIHPGSGRYSLRRRWLPSRFAEVGDALAEGYGSLIAIVGGPEEAELAQEVAGRMRCRPLNLAGKTTIKRLVALLGRCDLFVGGDSGVMHLAAAAGTRVVAIFGPSNHRAWGPYFPSGSLSGSGVSERGAIVRVDLPCSPCLYGHDWVGRRLANCSIECMRQVTTEMVLQEAHRLLATSETPERRLNWINRA
ncbi:MAG: glycosyltransferase family 9 protein [Dehalococcoidales bacterium]|nr:glycosyltransferase family 9 protein [Dehalococcoidales bacterium]